MDVIRSMIIKWVKVKAICNYVNDMQLGRPPSWVSDTDSPLLYYLHFIQKFLNFYLLAFYLQSFIIKHLFFLLFPH